MVASFSWFDRVSVFMDMKLLVCGIEKNGITVLNRALAAAQRKNFSWFPNNPSKEHLSLEAFKRLLQDPNNSWRKLVVYREPMERFLSAYHSSACSVMTMGRNIAMIPSGSTPRRSAS